MLENYYIPCKQRSYKENNDNLIRHAVNSQNVSSGIVKKYMTENIIEKESLRLAFGQNVRTGI